MKILMPVDGSDYTKHMLSYVAAHEELLGSGHEYVLFTVVLPVPPHVTRFLEKSTLDDYYAEQAEHVLSPVRTFVEQQGWKAKVRHVVGHPPDEIARMAEQEKPDLIVMGTHGHSALGNVILGSVTTGVIARTRAPVLLVR
jgi:nucleotide-binding universal stress UspA family protein